MSKFVRYKNYIIDLDKIVYVSFEEDSDGCFYDGYIYINFIGEKTSKKLQKTPELVEILNSLVENTERN